MYGYFKILGFLKLLYINNGFKPRLRIITSVSPAQPDTEI